MNNKQPDPETPSRSSVFVKDLIIAGVVGGLIFLMPLLHDAIVGGTASSNPFYWAFVGGGITFVGLLAFLQLPTKLFPYIVAILALAVFLIPAEKHELDDVKKAVEVPSMTVLQPEVPVEVQPEIVPPVAVEPEVPADVEPDTTLGQPETN
jgi:hypothetical protein